MSKEMLKHARLLALGLVLVVGLSYMSVYASEWVNRPSNPPQSNAERPINVGGESQEKEGGLSVQTFIATMAAQFRNDIYLSGMVRGRPLLGKETVSFGTTDSSGLYTTTIALTGDLDTKSAVSKKLANLDRREVCADANGTLFLCGGDPVPFDACSNIDGVQSTVPAGWHISTDAPGTCEENVVVPPPNTGGESCRYYVTAEPDYSAAGGARFRFVKLTLWEGYATATGSSGQTPHYSGTAYSGPFYRITFAPNSFATQNCIESYQQTGPDNEPIGEPQPRICDDPQVWSANGFSYIINTNPGIYEAGVWGVNGMRFLKDVVVKKTSAANSETITVPVECTNGFYR